MSPGEKRRVALISVAVLAVSILCLALYFIPTFLYVLLILGVCCAACFYHNGGPSQHTRLGPHPRPGLIIPPVLRRWLPGKTANGVPSAGRVSSRGNRARFIKGNPRDSAPHSRDRRWDSQGASRGESEEGGSLLFSPRDILMGSYLGKADSPATAASPARRGGGTLDLRERLTRPNSAVHSPNRRLSFGEPVAVPGRFTITPQRHYPLQQAGSSSLGVLPPLQWDGYRRKNVLTPRNSGALHSPVTVRIARPDASRLHSPLFDQVSSPLAPLSPGLGAPSDPCAKETVLNALKESRKRENDEEEERGYSAGQDSKRRRHDSNGSAHSAFEPLLANGAPSLLVPKPGTLKRGANSLAPEESVMKRSRTSSISSLSSALSPGGTLGSARNPILSSYSSSRGFAQKKTSALGLSPLSSPGSSRSQTPERPPKKPREDESRSSGFVSPAKSDRTQKDMDTETVSPSPALRQPLAVSSPASGGTDSSRKRKIQLVSSRRGDHISLPPPPELGYTITVGDLDSEKKAALSRIRKVLEEAEPVKTTAPPSVPTFSPVAVSSPGPTSLLLGLGTTLDPTPSAAPTTTAPAPMAVPAGVASAFTAAITTAAQPFPAAPATSAAITNPLLESLRKMQNSPSASSLAPSAAPVISVAVLKGPTPTPALSSAGLSMSSPAAPASLLPSAGVVKTEPSLAPPQLSFSAAPSTLTPSGSLSTSAFSQVLPGPATPSTAAAASSLAGAVTFGMQGMAQPAVPPSSTSTSSVSTGNLLPSAFKPVFGTPAPAVTTTTSAAAPSFKPVFGSATAGSAFGQPAPTPAATTTSSSMFGVISSTPATVSGAPTPAKSAFGSWGAPAPASNTAPTTTAGSSFQFGTPPAATAAPAPSFNSTGPMFQFGKAAAGVPTPNPAPTAQPSFSFGQPPSGQPASTTTFGGFGMSAAPITTTAPASIAAVPVSTSASASTTAPQASQTGFSFGKAFDGPSAFGSVAPCGLAKPFGFGAGGAVAATGTSAFAFGGAATSTAATAPPPSFGTTAPPAFGSGSSGSTGFCFGAPAATPPATAPPAFGSATQASVAPPAFGSTTQASVAPPAFGSTTQASTGQLNPVTGFSFGGPATTLPSTALPSQSAPQPTPGGFSFGASLSSSQFGTPAPPAQNQTFAFGNNKDGKPAFGFNFGGAGLSGTSTPAFGQGSAGGPIPFGSPGTPAPGFSALPASPFAATPGASFSIGSGSKPSARQRLQARRQHTRKK
ncbi:nuclear envelope pore membrane protein POM 121 isoform X1 [Amia ocellicauda]|uniref:nuclear envelope pore membrane protein POM 121 isoform X1 n=1 Tax=Amia ocellicauda TaxID=2972642 RepID=UPI003464A4FB